MDQPFEEVACNLCGGREYGVLYPATLPQDTSLKPSERFAPADHVPGHDQIVRCKRCGLIFVNPRMKREFVWQGYSEVEDKRYATQATERLITFRRILKKVETYLPGKGRLLDVGCAAGFFLKVAKDAGWQAEGIEPNRTLAEWGRRNYGLTIHTEEFLSKNYPSDSLDAITFWDVIEHTTDPRAHIREAYRVLKPGGFAFLNYPDMGSWITKLFGEKWWFISTVHLYYFDRRTLGRMLEEEGFRVVGSEMHWQTLSLGYLFEILKDFIRPLGVLGQKIVTALRLGRLPVRYYACQALIVVEKQKK